MVLPTPPFWFAMAMIRGSSKLSSSSWRPAARRSDTDPLSGRRGDFRGRGPRDQDGGSADGPERSTCTAVASGPRSDPPRCAARGAGDVAVGSRVEGRNRRVHSLPLARWPVYGQARAHDRRESRSAGSGRSDFDVPRGTSRRGGHVSARSLQLRQSGRLAGMPSRRGQRSEPLALRNSDTDAPTAGALGPRSRGPPAAGIPARSALLRRRGGRVAQASTPPRSGTDGALRGSPPGRRTTGPPPHGSGPSAGSRPRPPPAPPPPPPIAAPNDTRARRSSSQRRWFASSKAPGPGHLVER